MNRHLTDGQLRAALDGELAGIDLQHLEGCPACQMRREQIRSQVRLAAERLSFLAGPAPVRTPDAQGSLARFTRRTLNQKENSMFKKLFASPVLRAGLAIVVILALVLSIPATRAFADQILNLFRIQQVVVLPIDTTGMQQLTGNGPLGTQLSNLISSSTSVDQKPGAPTDAADAAQASQLAGFTVRLPAGSTPTRISVENAAAFTFTIDRTKAQTLLNEAGRPDLVLPDTIDGAAVSVNVPASVSAAYGTCPTPGATDNSLNLGGSSGRKYPDCVILAELPSPTVSAPAGVDVAQLAQIGLQFTGMTSDQAAAFVQSVDWASTLVIPIPKNAATYQQVTVDGVTGTLIQRPADDAPQYLLVWVKDGIVYAISSLGTDSQKAIDMANSLP